MEVDSLVIKNSYPAGAAYSKPAETAAAEQPGTAEAGSPAVNTQKSAAPKTGSNTKSNNAVNTGTAAKAEAANEADLESVLDKAIARANKDLYSVGREFNYSIHEKTRQVMIKVVDRESKEVIREIPPEKTLDAIAKMWELAGILVDEKR